MDIPGKLMLTFRCGPDRGAASEQTSRGMVAIGASARESSADRREDIYSSISLTTEY